MANTTIQIKRSQATADPGSLQYGELAYSFQSGKLFIGTSGGSSVAIGGNTYNQMLDAATSSNTFSTIVKRDASGNFSATNIYAELVGNALTASKWKTGRILGVDGDVYGQSTVDGSSDSNTTVTLKTVNSNVGTYGGSTNIPVFTVNAKGLVTSAANVAISSSFTISGNTGTDTFNNGETLNFAGGSGVTTAVTDNKVAFDLDNTVLRTSGNQSRTGSLTVNGDFSVFGNTNFQGNTSYINVNTFEVQDPLIYLAANNYYSDVVSIGFAANYFDGVAQLHTGLFRAPQSNNYYLFTGVTDELSNTNNVTPSANGFTRATLISNLSGGTVSGLASAINPSDGGTGLSSYTTGDIIFASGSTTLSKLSDVANGNVLLSGGVGTSPAYGKVGLTTHISGILGISNGGTNSTSTPTAGAIAYGNGTSYLFNSAGTSGQALKSGGSDAPTFGTLDLLGGGLGFTSPNANSAVFYGGSGNAMSYTNSATNGQVLQYSSTSGIQFGMLDGGSF